MSSSKIIAYLNQTTIHGLKYIGDKTISILERFFFVFAFLIVTILSGVYINNVYEKWSATPVIIGVNPITTSLKDIPFPAVTICNMNKARKSVAYQILPYSREYFKLLSVCNKQVVLNESYVEFKSTWVNFRKFLINISQTCAEMLVSCRFANYPLQCLYSFGSVLSDEGICCTFNAVHPKLLYKNYK